MTDRETWDHIDKLLTEAAGALTDAEALMATCSGVHSALLASLEGSRQRVCCVAAAAGCVARTHRLAAMGGRFAASLALPTPATSLLPPGGEQQ